jgi:hypothetical protein
MWIDKANLHDSETKVCCYMTDELLDRIYKLMSYTSIIKVMIHRWYELFISLVRFAYAELDLSVIVKDNKVQVQ